MISLIPFNQPPKGFEPFRKPAKQTLLIVDDEEGPRQSLRVVFKDDYHILLADNGRKAIELAQQNIVHAAVVDIRMAGMSGIELLERLKAIDSGIEVVMLTAYETIETVRQALRFGACDYLNKPFDLKTMRAAVASAMERRSLSDEIRSTNLKLAELQDELHNNKLQEEIAANRGEIYASIIHDINGPLTVISGFIQLINQQIGETRRVEGEDLETVKHRLYRVMRQVTHCIEISQRYLAFLRQHPSEAARVYVNQVLHDLQELLGVHPCAQQHQLEIVPLSEDTQLEVNGTDLMQILLNLAMNGFQSTDQPHTVRVSGRLLHEPLDLSGFEDGPRDRIVNAAGFNNAPPLIELCVQDDGPGICAEHLPNIFQPYFTTKSPSRGTGLGLSIVQRLVSAARGLIHLRTGAGSGTVFKIYFPAWSRAVMG
jgi:two-component system, sensor histidine kinase and response regulator